MKTITIARATARLIGDACQAAIEMNNVTDYERDFGRFVKEVNDVIQPVSDFIGEKFQGGDFGGDRYHVMSAEVTYSELLPIFTKIEIAYHVALAYYSLFTGRYVRKPYQSRSATTARALSGLCGELWRAKERLTEMFIYEREWKDN
jgi:hypothetical protein